VSELLDFDPEPDEPGEEVAVVGMAGRFPGAADLAELWQNLRNGVESISFFGDAELLAAGVSPVLLANPRYVRARGVLPGVELFDAPLFGFSPREATITDPQHRVFLECAWEALEQAGVDPESFPGRIGVYAGSIISTYLLFHLFPRVGADDDAGWQMMVANDKDALATRVSYKLNLRGPSVSVQTSCSTSLVAVHMARQALLDYECDLALAGGVSIRSPQTIGYLYQEAGIHSPDGHCRAFDAEARGTVFSSGTGIVVLKRLSDARADGDTVRAVLKGSAINNDGALKVGFTAPSVDGQAEVVARALAAAGVDPETVSYVEAHGTGTPLGDPIEMAALTRAFRTGTAKRGFCAVGSIKTNLGHLDSASGIAGLIKTVLALEHREIPPSLHFTRPNPQIDFAGSPFFVNDRLRPWEAGDGPRRAGVSSFGIGGTNAHVVVEEAPAAAETSPSRPWQLLVLSARTETALAASASRLAEHLRLHPEQDLADVAFTLQVGRRALPWRKAWVCRGHDEAITGMVDPAHLSDVRREGSPVVAFLFPGQGSQRPGMGHETYLAEPLFRREVDRAAEILRPHLGLDLRELLFPVEAKREEAARRLDRTAITQPALFVVEAALARLWMSWGVRPQAMLGHSVGEYVAAHLAGVLSLEDALKLVAARGRLIEDLPGGAMMAVPLPEGEVAPLLGTELSLAAVNGPSQCVVSGSEAAIEELRLTLAGRGLDGRRLTTSHAFHSRQMEALAEPFARHLRQVTLKPPEIPYLSNVTGRWVTAEEATDPAYWVRHLRGTVRFADGLAGLLAEPDRVLLEVGPGHALTRLARRRAELSDRLAVASLDLKPSAGAEQPEPAALLAALGRLWMAGVPVDWPGFYAGERRRRVPLPSYPFERRRYWVEPARSGHGAGVAQPAAGEDPATWFHLPSWRRSLLPASTPEKPAGAWLVLGDAGEMGLETALLERLQRSGEEVLQIPAEVARSGYAAVAAHLREEGRRPRFILHLRSLTPAGAPAPDGTAALERGFTDLTALTRALAGNGFGVGTTVVAVSNGVQRVTGGEDLYPVKATLLGWVRAAASSGPRCRSLDVALPAPGSAQAACLARLADHVLAEVRAEGSAPADPIVAWRGDDRWVPALEPAPLAAPARSAAWLRPGGSYLLTGGLEGLAFDLARRLAAATPLRLAFVSAPLPGDTAEVVERRRALAELGAEVLELEAAPGDREPMAAALARAEAAWGPFSGAFYLPGTGGAAEWMNGALGLDAFFGASRPLDFLALFSWLEPPPPARVHAEVWAGSALLDALAEERATRGAATVAVDWAPGVSFESEAAWTALDRILAHPTLPRIAVALAPLALSSTDSGAAPDGEPTGARPDLAVEYVAPDEPLGLRIAAIWQEVLGVARVGLHDRFFDLGGDSLVALQVMARLRDAFPVEMPVKALFEHPTVAGLRDVLEEALTARLEELPEAEAQRLIESFLG